MQLFFSIISKNKFSTKNIYIFLLLSLGIIASASAQYCIPSYTNLCSSNDYIENFSFNTLSKLKSGCNGNANNYIYDLTTTTTIDKGGAYAISMQSGAGFPQGFGVWIDYNKDGDFADAYEFVYASTSPSKELLVAYITIPSAASTGTTRLRIRCSYNYNMISSDYCSTFSYGETEDYNITIAQPPACNNPPIAGTAVATKTTVCNINTPFYLSLNGNPNGQGQTFQWQKSTNGTTWADMFGATTKAYYLTIQQSSYFRCIVKCSGTSISSSVYVAVAAPLTVNMIPTDVSCYGLNNGLLSAVVSGGTSPYSYAWSVGGSPIGPPRVYPNAPTIDSLYSNSFNVTIADVNGCSIMGSQWVGQPNSIFLQKDTGYSTCGSSTGWASVTVFGGTQPYSYLWQGGLIKDTITALAAGIYAVTVTDGNGCKDSTKVAVSDLGTPALTFTTTPGSCSYSSNGTAIVTASGGVPPFNFLWNTTPAQTTSLATGLKGGTHFVTVSNLSGCKSIGSVTLFPPSPLASGVSSYSATCIGAYNGQIYTSSTGGTWPHTYLWSTGSTNSFIDSLSAGSYSLTITDNKGCVLNETHAIAQPKKIAANANQQNVTCFGLGNGKINLSPSGGNPPYSYNWSPLNYTGNSVSGLLPGSYSVIVTASDTCGDADTAYVTITQPITLSSTITNNSATCFGLCTGFASAASKGGTGAYTYLWQPSSATTSAASNLCAGTYSVLITDSLKCTLLDTASIGQPLPIPATASVTPTSCGAKSGAATVSVSGPGAIPPFSYLWTTGSTNTSITGLNAGTYRANVTDGNGCFGFADALITSSNGPAITTNSVTAISCFGKSNGSIDIAVTGGATPYTYLWSNGATTQDVSNLSYGPYEVKVTDAANCAGIKSIFVTQPSKLTLNSNVINSGCTASNGYAAMLVSGGTSPYSYLWAIGGTTPAKAGLSAGFYKINITDFKGCKDSTLLAVQDSGGPVVSIDTIAGVSCGGNGFVLIEPQNANLISTYLWNNGNTTQNLLSATAGNYGVVVTDVSGCKSVLVSTVTPVLPPIKPICITTVDTISNKNIVVWEKPVSAAIAGFNIYRESSSQGIFQKIAYSPYLNVSTYYDVISDPSIKWARYKISMLDLCGTESPLSSEHKTIHLSVQSSTPTTTTLIWDAHVGFSFAYYNIYRKDSTNGAWEFLAALPSSFTTYTDIAVPQTGDTVSYHVDVDHVGGDCIATIKNPVPQATSVKSSKSNSSERPTSPGSSVSEITANSLISIFPNPSNGEFTILNKKGLAYEVKIINALGEEIKKIEFTKTSTQKIDLRNQPKGIYIIHITTEENTFPKKMILN